MLLITVNVRIAHHDSLKFYKILIINTQVTLYHHLFGLLYSLCYFRAALSGLSSSNKIISRIFLFVQRGPNVHSLTVKGLIIISLYICIKHSKPLCSWKNIEQTISQILQVLFSVNDNVSVTRVLI